MSQSTQNTFSPVSELRWLFFDLNSYFASVEQQDRPELRGKPIAVIPSDTDATCAIAASYEAKAYGIKTGTKIYDAKKMCPDLICVLARHDKYVEYHSLIIKEVNRHIPVTKICSIDEAACEIFKGERNIHDAKALARQIKQGLCDNVGEYIKCSIGLAPNAFLAKTATDMQKPDGLVVLEPHDFQHQLFRLELGDLCGIGHNMNRRLHDAGITSVKKLWDAPPKQIRKIWGGVGGERFWYSLHGYDIPDTPTTKSMVGHSRMLDPIHRPKNEAYGVTRHLATKACTRLRKYELYACKMSLNIKTVSKSYWRKETTFPAAQDNFKILQRLEALWGSMAHDVGGVPILKTSVALYGLRKKEEITLDLFDVADAKGAQQATELTRAIDAINQRFGTNAVSIGTCPKTSAGFVGTKIAFTRVPTQDEF